MNHQHPVRHLLRAKDLADARYREPLDVEQLAEAAHLSRAHFSREFRRAFGESPHRYLLMRRMERAAALLRNTDRSVADVCLQVGLRSEGSQELGLIVTVWSDWASLEAAMGPDVTEPYQFDQLAGIVIDWTVEHFEGVAVPLPDPSQTGPPARSSAFSAAGS